MIMRFLLKTIWQKGRFSEFLAVCWDFRYTEKICIHKLKNGRITLNDTRHAPYNALKT